MVQSADLDVLLSKIIHGTPIPGIAVCAYHNGEILAESYQGNADIEKNIPVTSSSIFRMASMTKLMTYTVFMMLYEKGLFLLTDPLYDYLPDWKHSCCFVPNRQGAPEIVPTSRPITILDALIMTCGLPYCMAPLAFPSDNPTLQRMSREMEKLCQNGRIPELREEGKAMSSVPLQFDPGTHWLYGFGSEIVGLLLEALTGKSVRRNLREKLIDPLGLKDTGAFLDDRQYSQLVRLYHFDGASLTAQPEENDLPLREGGAPEYSRTQLNSSARDYALFMNMLACGGVWKGERFLSPGTIELMRTNYLSEVQLQDYHNANGEDCLGYGYGLGFRTLLNRAEAGHNGPLGAFGWSGGYGTWTECSPEAGLSIVSMHNLTGYPMHPTHMRVRNLIYSLN